ncbi:MAG: DMT family transporter [Acidobacteriota bacterium]|nr:DMT family transporter [Acidobacteriota bacterium]
MKGQKAPQRWQADLSLAIVALVWGATFVIVKRALDDISTVYFLAVRFSLAALCMIPIFFRQFQQAGVPAVLRGLRAGAAVGVFLWLGYMLQTFGLKYTTAGNSGFLTGLYVVLVPFIGAIVYRRAPQARELGGIALATAGMAAVTFPSMDRSLHMNRGDLLTLGCAVAFAFQLLLLSYYSQRELVAAVALGQIASTALLSICSLPFEPPRAVWNPSLVFAIVSTAIFATALAFALQTWGQKYTTATRTALIFALEPVFALATAVSFGREALTAAAVIGGTLILAGILAVELKPAAKT